MYLFGVGTYFANKTYTDGKDSLINYRKTDTYESRVYKSEWDAVKSECFMNSFSNSTSSVFWPIILTVNIMVKTVLFLNPPESIGREHINKNIE